MQIYPLLEGTFNVTKQKDFIYLFDEYLPSEGVNMNICPFLVQTDDELILIDCGFGTIKDTKTYLISKLNSYGFSENDVTIILISHLHKDHINGLGFDFEGKFECYYPNATIYIQKREMDYALNQNSFSYDFNFLRLLKNYSKINYLHADRGQILDTITYEVVGGHVPFQQVFWIEDDCEIVFFGADNLPQINYFKYQAAFKNDIDGTKAMNDRIKWYEKATKNNWTILFYHGKKTLMKKF